MKWLAAMCALLAAGTLASVVPAAPGVAAQAPEAASPAVEESGTPATGLEPFTGEFESLEEPGFVLRYQNCDGTLPTADRLTLPRRLSSRYTDMTARVRAVLTGGQPTTIELVDGDEPLFEAIRWHVERARFAPGEPACVVLHYQVVDTVRKASEIVEFRVWVDAALRPDGTIERATLADELANEAVAEAILRQVEAWQLQPTVRDGVEVPVETSLRVEVHMEPSGWTTYTITTRLARRGPRPTRMVPASFPRRVDSAVRRGSVVMEFMVSEKGKPVDPTVVDSEPPGVFDRYALATIKRWRYKPDTVNGEAEMTGPVRQVLRFDAGHRPDRQPSVPRGSLRSSRLPPPPASVRGPRGEP